MKRFIVSLVLLALPLWATAAEVFINPQNPAAMTDDERKELRDYEIQVVEYLNGINVDVSVARRGGNLGFSPQNRKPEELIAIISKKVKADKKNYEVSTTNKLPGKS
jgi:hypothetical protein